MAAQNRDDQGRFNRKLRDQDILKTFDVEACVDDPYLTVAEVVDGLETHFDIGVSDETVRLRLQEMVESGLVDRREFGPSVAYRALVGPQLSEAAADRSEERRKTARDEFIEL